LVQPLNGDGEFEGDCCLIGGIDLSEQNDDQGIADKSFESKDGPDPSYLNMNKLKSTKRINGVDGLDESLEMGGDNVAGYISDSAKPTPRESMLQNCQNLKMPKKDKKKSKDNQDLLLTNAIDQVLAGNNSNFD